MTPSMLTANPTALKWPFSYAGVKRELLPVILPILRRIDAEAYVMPFLGGGAVELAMAGRGYTCYAADADAELVNVWHSISAAPAAVAAAIDRLAPMDKAKHKRLAQELTSIDDPIQRAAVWLALAHTAFGERPNAGYCHSAKRNTLQHAVRRIAEFRKPLTLTITCADYADMLAQWPNLPAYLDPPYYAKRFRILYRHTFTDADHAALAAILRQRQAPWLLSIDDCPEVRELYAGCKFRKVQVKYRLAVASRGGYTGGELLVKSGVA